MWGTDRFMDRCVMITIPPTSGEAEGYLWFSKYSAKIILGMCPANERRRYNVTPSLIGWAHAQNDPCRVYACDLMFLQGCVTDPKQVHICHHWKMSHRQMLHSEKTATALTFTPLNKMYLLVFLSHQFEHPSPQHFIKWPWKFKVTPLDYWMHLSHWGRVTRESVTYAIIGSDNSLSPGWRQDIVWTNAVILSIGP